MLFFKGFNTETKSSDDEIVSNEEWTRQREYFAALLSYR